MLKSVNKEVISFLFKGDLPQQQVAQNIHEARFENRSNEQYTESRNENEVAERNATNSKEAPQRTETVVREMPKINRNDTVTIKHVLSGKTESMKYKKAESMLASGEWVLVNE
jgi:preprotein translocase subunit SecA